ncbi:MAG TPA: hypothetical protein VF651_05905 [Gammaproteobacteria bacterium]
MEIVLQTNKENPSLVFQNVTRFRDSSGYAVDLSIASGAFSAIYPFYFEEYPLTEFISSLSAMDETLSGKATLKPMWEKQFIEFIAGNSGHVTVRGELLEHGAFTQKLAFGFKTDQTCLGPFIRALKSMQTMDPE